MLVLWSTSRFPFLLVPFAVLALHGVAAPQGFEEQAKLSASDAAPHDSFGFSVSIAGATAAVGAFAEDRAGVNTGEGAVYMYVRNGTVWTQQAKLVANDAAPGDAFGYSVSLSGETLLVGALGDDEGSFENFGAAYIFLRTGTTWTQQAKLVASPPARSQNDFLGESVALSGETAVVGVPGFDAGSAYDGGSALVFVRDGTTWSQQALLTADDMAGGDAFGTSVSIAGDTVVVGAAGDSHFDTSESREGSAYVFVRSGTTWAQQAKLIASDGADFDDFGRSVSVSGDTILVGADFDDLPGVPGTAGSAYVFVRSGTSWTQQAKLVAGDAAASDQFGISVSLVGHTALVGAPIDDHAGGLVAGSAYVFTRSGNTWFQRQKLVASDATGFEQFGTSVALAGDTAIVGAYVDDLGSVPGSNEGSARVFAAEGGPCITFDFESEDDLITALVNGQHIDTEFGTLVTLTSSGPNAGLAIFDSTVGGPNDPSQDRDLLVDTGNILILQTENYPPNADDIFPRPNDDEDGGMIRFAFVTPIEAQWLRLIDLDAGDGGTTIVLADSAARRRTYTVPSQWTGDRLLSQPGQGFLDLTTLDPQPGFASTAVGVEDPGFDPASVTQLEVHMNGSGALDDLSVCTPSLARASAAARNGSGANPMNLNAGSLPVLGSTWQAVLDCSAQRGGIATLVLRNQAATGIMWPFGEVLVGGDLVFRADRSASGSASRFSWDVPRDIALCGMELHAQGLCLNLASSAAPKVSRARARLSNALDLVLGF